jgi:Domain of Unknown Function (DUF349)
VGYILEAEALLRVEKFSDGHARALRLRTLFKEAGSAGKRNAELRRRFDEALNRFYEEHSRRRQEREKRFADAAAKKRGLVSRAGQLASSSDWKATGDELHRLMDAWKTAGFAGKPLDEQLWREFHDARKRFFDRRSEHFKQQDRKRAESRHAKQRLVSEANSVAESHDFGPAFARMRELMSRWKAAGSAGKEHEEQLWASFRAAGDRLRARADANRDQAAHLKQRIVEEASSIAAYGDLRTAGHQMRDLMTRWKAAGSAGKIRDDDLWSRYLAYRRQLDSRYEQSKAERGQRTRDFLARLEQAAQRKREALARTESRIWDISNRPPIRPGPRQYEFIAQREAKLGELAMKRDSIARSVMEVEAKIAEVRQQL